MPEQRPVFIFLHIPKTAGTSLVVLLGNVLGESRVMRLREITEEGLQNFRVILGDDQRSVSCISGHIPAFWLGKEIENVPSFTMLRHPVSRVLSLFRFLSVQPETELNRLGLKTDFRLEDLLQSNEPELYQQVNDGMCRLLSSDARFSAADAPEFRKPDPEALLQGALNCLRKMRFGIVEKMDDALAELARFLGCPFQLQILDENRTDVMGSGSVSPADIAKIISLNTLDLSLYRWAEEELRARKGAVYPTKTFLARDQFLFHPRPGVVSRISDIPGRLGFHEAEADQFAWLSASVMPRIHFVLPADPCTLRLTMLKVSPSYPANDCVFRVNGRIVSAVFHEDPALRYWFNVDVGPIHVESEVGVLTIEAPYFVPARYISAGSGDRRALGLGLSTAQVM